MSKTQEKKVLTRAEAIRRTQDLQAELKVAHAAYKRKKENERAK